MNDFYIVSFNSTHHAIRSEKILLDDGLKIMTLPTPREVAASCGLSIKFEFEDKKRIKELLEENSIDIKGVYHILRNESGDREALEIEF
ncbi:MAG: DUF3343 domain-containing protein [Peptostreptococcus porci]|uniref:DUF3343 domain-containing protein n=1 Tax=Peptostreptococcus porci TaxID=2652282 RepID=UPI0023F0C0C6|nr:DUF3343 domain-containing protein [Peptostreptococcus porci]MDD7182610.1 DUF3343 domain-containing protein [Peptostreptococcus porci]MDY4561597.1 DUF3343 domain-containing protein [Peptostreptococcus porci]MDY5478938.1 DUF3343 domain-containing protein [Peptostreptococcus porci]MDY5964100.1 DUF3343 domain-containing protein [Peptostreptococcus porci]